MIEKLFAATKLDADSLGIPQGSAQSTLDGTLNTIYFLAGAVAIITIVVAGLTLVTAQGNPEQMSKSRSAIIYALIGLIVIALAFTVTQIVIGRSQI